MRTSSIRSWLLPLAALGLAGVLSGCVAYPAYPAYGYGYGPRYAYAPAPVVVGVGGGWGHYGGGWGGWHGGHRW